MKTLNWSLKLKLRREKEKFWHWPFKRINFNGAKEYSCRHGVGHGGIHGCDGCCTKDPNFPPRFPRPTEESEGKKGL